MAGETIKLRLRLAPEDLAKAGADIKKLDGQTIEVDVELEGQQPVKEAKGILGEMRKELERLERARDEAFSEDEVKQYTAEIGKLQSRIEGLTSTQTKSGGLGVNARSIALIGTATAAMAGFASQIKTGVEGMLDLDQATRKIGTLGVADFKKFEAEALRISEQVPETAADVANAIYDAISAGVSESGAAAFVEEASKAAVAGAATTGEAVNLGSSILNAYKKDVSEIGQVFDVTFTAVKNGKTSFSELNAAMANVLPTASAAKISYEAIAAAMASMTKQGIPTAQASTKLNQAIIEVQKPGDILGKVLKGVGIESGALALKQKGLHETFNLIAKGAREQGLELAQVFGSTEAAAAVIALTGENAAVAAADLEAMGAAAGAAGSAFDTASKSYKTQLASIQNTIDNLFIKLAQKLQPAFEAILPEVQGFVSSLEDVLPVIADVLPLVATAVAGYYAYKGALAAASIAQKGYNALLATNPWAIAIAGIAATVIAIRALNGAQKESAEKAAKQVDAEIEITKRQKEQVQVSKKRVENNLKLLDTYEQLGGKTNRTQAEELKLRETMVAVNREYPGLIQNGDSFAANLKRIKEQAEKTKSQLSKYQEELTRLNETQRLQVIKKAESDFNVVLKRLNNLLTDEDNDWFENTLNMTDRDINDLVTNIRVALNRAKDEFSRPGAIADANALIQTLDIDDVEVMNEAYGLIEKAADAAVVMQQKIAAWSAGTDKLTDATKEVNEESGKTTKTVKEQTGSIEGLRKKLSELQAQYDKLSDAGRFTQRGLDIAQAIADTNDKIQDAEAVRNANTRQALEEFEKINTDFLDSAIAEWEKTEVGLNVGIPDEKLEETRNKVRALLISLGKDSSVVEGATSPELEALQKRYEPVLAFLEDLRIEFAALGEASIEALADMTEGQKEKLNETIALSQDIGKAMGTGMANAIAEGTPVVRAALKAMLLVFLDYLEKQAIAAAAGVTLEEVLTKGPIGFITGAASAAAIYALFESAKGAITAFGTGGVIVGDKGLEVIAPAKEFSEFAGQIVANSILFMQRAMAMMEAARYERQRTLVQSEVRLVATQFDIDSRGMRVLVEQEDYRDQRRVVGGP